MVGFKVDDKVFGKVKGYPAWPARVTSVNGKRYGVVFYGTNETGTLKQDNVFYYLTNKHKFPMQKRKFYAEAIKDIELDIAKDGGTDGNPNALDEEHPEEQRAQTKGNKRKRQSNAGKKSSDTPTASSKRIKLQDANHNHDESQNENTNSQNIDTEINLPMTEETKTEETNNDPEHDNDKNFHPDGEKIDEITEAIPKNEPKTIDKQETDETKEEIKENPYYTGEINVKDVNLLPDVYLTAITTYAERVQDNSHFYKINKPDAISLDNADDSRLKVLPIKIGADNYCGLIYHPQPLDIFRSEYDRAIAEAKLVQELLELKAEIEVGNLDISDHRFIKTLNCDDDYVVSETNSSLVAYKKSKLQWLQREMEVFKLLIEIKKCLGLKEAKTQDALTYMKQLLDSTIEAISLKKRSFFVDTIVRLGKYVGNIREWMLEDKEVEKFEEDASKIRETADEILKKVRGLFEYGEPADKFLENFDKDCEVFNEATKGMSEAEVFSLCAEPLSRKAQLELIFDEQAYAEDANNADAMYTPD